MSYTLTLLLPMDLPTWQLDTIASVLDEHGVTRRGSDTMEVTGRDEEHTRRASTAALQRIGKTVADVEIDLFS